MSWFIYCRWWPDFEGFRHILRSILRWICQKLREGCSLLVKVFRFFRRGRVDSEGGEPPGGRLRDEEDDDFDSEEYRVKSTDELFCGYDSTWETEEDSGYTFNNRRRPAASRYKNKFSRFENAAKDMQNYRHNYPSQTRPDRWIGPVNDDMPNLNFYLGKTASKPDGVYIHIFHNEWHGRYEELEYVHTYIQWLFPLKEPGMNSEASPLTKEEVEGFLRNSTAKENLLKSYQLMLDFYGIELCDETTGKVQRARNWRDRFNNLNSKTHNSLRITRILKCQGTLGYSHYQAPLVHFFLEETLVKGELPNVKDSVLNYFVFAVLDKKERRRLIKFAYLNYDHKDEFVWCPKKIQMMWSKAASSRTE
ncbi:opioid growth factor receptor-like [Micropterus dolomieu]|uniref:opioid growth factor receptor-like n=1 Tax=Micropterus dolomieu TaxID=147949 RepID=UPI001E8E7035|nr:opioid growth factor receptor-like [Micropterus dolomieu]